jgi:hypothetical protein
VLPYVAGMDRHAPPHPPIGWVGVSWSFPPCWVWTTILPNSASLGLQVWPIMLSLKLNTLMNFNFIHQRII